MRVFRAQSAAAFAGGTFDGVSLDSEGVLRGSRRWNETGKVAEPFVFSAARHGENWILGTGNSGRVLEVNSRGAVRELFATAEPEVFAVWVDRDGMIFAGSSPSGKVYRYDGRRAEVFFDPQETYIWALARSTTGDLLVATGTQGKLFAVDRAGEGRTLLDLDEPHVRALGVGPDGRILVGTSGEGRILRLSADGANAETLHDAAAPEIVGFTWSPDGAAWAAALESEAGLVESAQAAAAAAAAAAAGAPPGSDRAGSGVVSVTLGDDEAGTRAAATPGGPRSEILKILASGLVESTLVLRNDTVFSLAWHRDRLWLGTGVEGKLYSVVEATAVLEHDFEDRQLMAMAPIGPTGLGVISTNGAAVHATDPRRSAAGTFTSAPLDAGLRSRFGVYRWRGEEPPGSTLRVSLRSGLSREPDATWSTWTAPRSGREIAIADVAPGRYLQWRAEFAGSTANDQADGGPLLRSVEISYRAENVAPRIRRFVALDPGEILVPANFNPGNQVYEPAHPNRQGLFDTLEPTSGGDETRMKTLWKRGMRTLRWELEDPNQDALVSRLEFRREGGPAHDMAWMAVAEDLRTSHYAFDETALPDGVYRFRLTVSDQEANEPGAGLEATRTSEPVVIDGTPPRVLGVERGAGGLLRVRVEDALNPLREALVSIDAGEWKPLATLDGLLDGHAEVLLVEVPAQSHLVLLRLSDAAFNMVTVDLLRAAGGKP